MRSATLFTSILTVPPLVVAAFALTGARTEPTVERVDFGKTITATQPVYNARLAPATDPSAHSCATAASCACTSLLPLNPCGRKERPFTSSVMIPLAVSVGCVLCFRAAVANST